MSRTFKARNMHTYMAVSRSKDVVIDYEYQHRLTSSKLSRHLMERKMSI